MFFTPSWISRGASTFLVDRVKCALGSLFGGQRKASCNRGWMNRWIHVNPGDSCVSMKIFNHSPTLDAHPSATVGSWDNWALLGSLICSWMRGFWALAACERSEEHGLISPTSSQVRTPFCFIFHRWRFFVGFPRVLKKHPKHNNLCGCKYKSNVDDFEDV